MADAHLVRREGATRLPVPLALSAGWNLVSLLFSPTGTSRAGDLIAGMAQQNVTAVHLARWRP